MKRFNTTAVCIPTKHYMVDLSERVAQIKLMVDDGKYFAINRARQYGKTTTLYALNRYLSSEYDVVSIDFQDITGADYLDENEFVKGLAGIICDARDNVGIPVPGEYYEALHTLSTQDKDAKLNDLFRIFEKWCRNNNRPVVLMIDEVDSASNNQVFLDFLGKLRSSYIKKEGNENYRIFQSVILAGVTDIRHLKAKIRPDEAHKQNSPWNIASDFNIDMSLSEDGIRGMLDEYEGDHHTGMDTAYIAGLIRDYTSGYPFLVSRICEIIDIDICKNMPPKEAWTKTGIERAVKAVMSEKNPLFETAIKNLNDLPKMKSAIRSILMEGTRLTWNNLQDDIDLMQMYGLICNDHGYVRVSNRIFETMLYNLFLSDEELRKSDIYQEGLRARNVFITDGRLDVRLIMERFILTYTQVCGPLVDRFNEKDGREQFLLYLKPIINGTGNYYIEAQTRDQTRTDVVIDYLGQQYIIELKIWRGPRYNADGEKQISDYMNYFGLTTGYMLSFNFNKKKEQGVKRIVIDGKVLYEGTV